MDISVSRKDYNKILLNKYLEIGPDGFMELEFLELILMFTVPRRFLRNIAFKLLSKYGSFKGVQDAPVRELLSIPYMDIKTVALLKLTKDSAVFYLKQRILGKKPVFHKGDLINYCRLSMEGLRDECFRVAFLNVQNEVISIETIHTGTVDQTTVYPRKIIERTFHHNAVALILMHNHPGGGVKPSAGDNEITKSIKTIAENMDIEIYDHIIIGRGNYFSFRDEGLLF